MSRWNRIEEELSHFILMGGLMDEKARRQTAELVFFFLFDPQYPAEQKLLDSPLPNTYPNWTAFLQRLLRQKELRKLSVHNEDFAFSVAREALNWCKSTFAQFQASHAYVEEESRYEHLRKHTETTEDQWLDTLNELQQRYPEEETWTFYQGRIRELAQEAGSLKEVGGQQARNLRLMQRQVLATWASLLQSKKSVHEEGFLEEAFGRYYEQLQRKVKQLHDLGDLLSPFYRFLGQAWNDSLGNWDKINWDKLEEYAQQLQRDSQLRELANLLGKWEQTQHELEEESWQEPVPEASWQPNPYGKSEIIGIHHSNHISAMLPTEIALLSDPDTTWVFSKKYVEHKLLTFQYRAQDIQNSPQMQEERAPDHKPDMPGPFILCIDTSGSMFGGPERMAKALALAILEIALEKQRKAYLISFSTGIQTFEMTGMEQDLSRLINFIRMSFHGGTDLQPALEAALDQLGTDRYTRADVLVISDFVIPRLERKLFDRIEERRQSDGTHFHSLLITRRPDPNQTPLPIFDNHWVYDLNNPRVIRQSVRDLEKLGE
ncbi:MAG: VWA domain-containing protein [Bacteroidota bacterium]